MLSYYRTISTVPISRYSGLGLNFRKVPGSNLENGYADRGFFVVVHISFRHLLRYNFKLGHDHFPPDIIQFITYQLTIRCFVAVGCR